MYCTKFCLKPHNKKWRAGTDCKACTISWASGARKLAHSATLSSGQKCKDGWTKTAWFVKITPSHEKKNNKKQVHPWNPRPITNCHINTDYIHTYIHIYTNIQIIHAVQNHPGAKRASSQKEKHSQGCCVKCTFIKWQLWIKIRSFSVVFDQSEPADTWPSNYGIKANITYQIHIYKELKLLKAIYLSAFC